MPLGQVSLKKKFYLKGFPGKIKVQSNLYHFKVNETLDCKSGKKKCENSFKLMSTHIKLEQ